MISGYEKWRELGYHNTALNFTSYAISQMPNFDLNCNILEIGEARVGKSTLALEIIRRFYSARMGLFLNEVDVSLIVKKWVETNVVYDSEGMIIPLREQKAQAILGDEGVLIADKRESMQAKQIAYTKYINRYAENNNLVFTLIQNLEDLDARIYSKANVIALVYERGKALLFARIKNFPIIRDNYEFDKFKKFNYMLKTEEIGLYNLKKLSSYIGDVRFIDLEAKHNILYTAYKARKKASDITATSTKSRNPLLPDTPEQERILRGLGII